MPLDKIVTRRQRSFDELAWFFHNVDRCLVFDNSTGEPTLIAEQIKGPTLLCWEPLPSDLRDTLRRADIRLLDFTPGDP